MVGPRIESLLSSDQVWLRVLGAGMRASQPAAILARLAQGCSTGRHASRRSNAAAVGRGHVMRCVGGADPWPSCVRNIAQEISQHGAIVNDAWEHPRWTSATRAAPGPRARETAAGILAEGSETGARPLQGFN